MDNLMPQTNTAMIQLSQMDAARVTDNAKAIRNLEKIDELSRDFEAVFMTEMMKPMFEGISTDGLFGGGKGEEIFRGILLQEYGKDIATRGNGIGLASHVKAELLRLQDTQYAEEVTPYVKPNDVKAQ